MTDVGSEARPVHGKLATLLVAMVVVAVWRSSAPPAGGRPPAPDALSAAAGVLVAQGPACGSFNIRTAADWNDFRKVACNTLTGDLRISTPDLAELTAPSLRHVQGDLVLHLGPTVTHLDLPRLEEVGTRVIIEGESALKSVVLPALKTVRGGFAVKGTSLTTLEVPMLAKVSGRIEVIGNSALTGLTLPMEELYQMDLEVRDNAALQSLRLPGLKWTNQRLWVEGNEALTLVELPKFREGNALYVIKNSKLVDLDLPALQGVSRLDIKENPSLKRVSLPALKDASVFLTGSPALESLAIPKLTTVTELGISRTGLTSLDFPALTEARGKLTVLMNPALERIEFPLLPSIERLELNESPHLKRLGLPALVKAQKFKIVDCPALESWSLPSLSFVDSLAVQRTGMTRVELPALSSAVTIKFTENARLKSLAMPMLTSVQSSLEILHNSELKELQLSALTLVATLDVGKNASLRQCLVDEIEWRATVLARGESEGNDGTPNTCETTRPEGGSRSKRLPALPVPVAIDATGCATTSTLYFFFKEGLVVARCGDREQPALQRFRKGTWVADEQREQVVIRLGAHWGERADACEFDRRPFSLGRWRFTVSQGPRGPKDPEFSRCWKVAPIDPDPHALLRTFKGKYPETSMRKLTPEELQDLSTADLRLMRNEVFARYGYRFRTDDLLNHFTFVEGYIDYRENVDALLSDIEKANVELLLATEKSRQ